MGLYNWIEIPDVRCPVCGEVTTILVQNHTASSPDGDDRGLFCLQTYHLGQRMRWFPQGSPEFNTWREDGMAVEAGDGKLQEACYSHCRAHDDALYAVIEYVDVTPVRLVAIGPENDWPPGFPR